MATIAIVLVLVVLLPFVLAVVVDGLCPTLRRGVAGQQAARSGSGASRLWCRQCRGCSRS
jgi:hypothetical protein